MAGFATNTLNLVTDYAILSEMTYDELLAVTEAQHLTIFGILAGSTGSIILLGPHEPSYWPAIGDSPEWQDGRPDPVDRWSRRIIESLAQVTGSKPHFPFGEQPAPFLKWALASDRAWQSPIGMAVQAEAGLLVSYRGALELKYSIQASRRENPCPSCKKPCMTACPVGALIGSDYDLDACWGYMRADSDQRCLSAGCLVRRACPISSLHPRIAEHSAYHMQQFLK